PEATWSGTPTRPPAAPPRDRPLSTGPPHRRSRTAPAPKVRHDTELRLTAVTNPQGPAGPGVAVRIRPGQPGRRDWLHGRVPRYVIIRTARRNAPDDRPERPKSPAT